MKIGFQIATPRLFGAIKNNIKKDRAKNSILCFTHFAKQNISNLHSKYIETEGYIEFLQSKNISTHAVCLIRCLIK